MLDSDRRLFGIPICKAERDKIPFVLGGEFSLDNLYLFSSVKNMRSRGNIANQILDLPDGMEIQIKVEK